MTLTKTPVAYTHGERLVTYLKSQSCPNFRAHTDTILSAVEKGYVTYEQLGLTQEALLQYAVFHAERALLERNRYHFVDLAVLQKYVQLLSQVQSKAVAKPTTLTLVTTRDDVETALAA